MDSTWLWFFIGIAFIIAEFAVPGVVLVFFGLGAWMVSGLCKFGVIDSLAGQIIVWLVSSVCLIFVLRTYLKSWFYGGSKGGEDDPKEEFIGHTVTVIEAVPGGAGTGKVEIKGANWNARSEVAIEKGSIAEVLEMDGITLIVKPSENKA